MKRILHPLLKHFMLEKFRTTFASRALTHQEAKDYFSLSAPSVLTHYQLTKTFKTTDDSNSLNFPPHPAHADYYPYYIRKHCLQFTTDKAGQWNSLQNLIAPEEIPLSDIYPFIASQFVKDALVKAIGDNKTFSLYYIKKYFVDRQPMISPHISPLLATYGIPIKNPESESLSYLAHLKETRKQFVLTRVINGTPDPDGHCRAYWLRLPPAAGVGLHCALSWSYHLPDYYYRPMHRT